MGFKSRVRTRTCVVTTRVEPDAYALLKARGLREGESLAQILHEALAPIVAEERTRPEIKAVPAGRPTSPHDLNE